MRKLFTLIFAIALIFTFTGMAMAFGNCGGDPCPQVTATAHSESDIDGAWVNAPDNEWAGGGQASADATLSADATATGEDGEISFLWWRWFVPGEAEADALTTLTMSSDVDVHTNGPQGPDGGLSYTCVKATSTLDIDGEAWAEGNQGCLQTASIDIEGELSAYVYGNSFSDGPNGSFATAGGFGTTTVEFEGFEQDTSCYGFLGILPNKASVDFHSSIDVSQGLFTASYVSPDGTLSGNYAIIGGGSAELDLGRDGLFGRDNIDLTGIQAQGYVSQTSQAVGYGAYAYGSSTASFSGATGYVANSSGWCGPDQTANVGGVAIVAGYNQVTTGLGSLTVTSHQYGYANTGN